MNKYPDTSVLNTKAKLLIYSVITLIVLIILFFQIRVVISAGERGVLFRPFSDGILKERTFGEGFHFILPWNKMIVYDVRQHEVSENMGVLSSNGLEINTDISIWFRPEPDQLGYLHALIGEDYLNKVIKPSLRSAARNVIGRYTPEQIYSTKRESIQIEISQEVKELITKKYLVLEEVLIRDINLPPTIKKAIESKLKQEQESLEYEFRLTKAQKEAERQKIEAEGKAIANRIISQSLTDQILREKGIEATLKLANSSNSKTVVIGSGKNGMPLILGN